MKTGLILGGGGVVGVAWELGVLAGLQQAIGFDPLKMDVIVGSSAGSAVGAMVAAGQSLFDLLETQRQGAEDEVTHSVPAEGHDRPTGGTAVVPEEIMRLITSAGAGSEETAAAIGKLALEAPVAIPEEAFVAYFHNLLGADAWPLLDFRPTTIDCHNGKTVLWSRRDGIGLARAVASSCAVPGHFPTVEFNGRRYTDGPRAPFCAQLVKDKGLEALIFIGPQILLPQGGRTVPEIDELAGRGLPTVQITGGQALEAFAVDLMDPRGRSKAVDIGVAEGAAWAPKVAAALAGA
jgi:NTE family protein